MQNNTNNTNGTNNDNRVIFEIDENNQFDITNNKLLRAALHSGIPSTDDNILNTIQVETIKSPIYENLEELIKSWSDTNKAALDELLKKKNLYSLKSSNRLIEASKASWKQLENCINLLEATFNASTTMEAGVLKEVIVDNKDKFTHDLDLCKEKISNSDSYIEIGNMSNYFEECMNRLCKAQLKYELGEWQDIKRQTDDQIQAFENRMGNENRIAIAKVINPDFNITIDAQTNMDEIDWPNIEDRINEPQVQARINYYLSYEPNANINPTGYINLYKIKNFSNHRIDELSYITSDITLPRVRIPEPDNKRELYNNKKDYLDEIKTFRKHLLDICHVNPEDIPQHTSRRNNPKALKCNSKFIENEIKKKRDKMNAFNYSGGPKLKELNSITRRAIIAPQKAFNNYVMKPLASLARPIH